MVGGGVLACGSALVRVRVRVNPCGARGGVDRSHTAVWNRRGRGRGRERVSLLSHGEASHLSSVSTLLKCKQADEPQVWPISP